MKILLVSATEMEIRLFREDYDKNRDSHYEGIDIHFLTTGVGMLATAARLAPVLRAGTQTGAGFDLVIQAGIAGSFDTNISLGQVYQVSNELIADLGVMEEGEWKDVFDMGLEDGSAAPYHQRRLPASDLEYSALAELQAVPAVTVNEISTDPARIQTIIDKYQPSLESMEGAALHFVAIEAGVPFIQLRAVSNYVGERSKTNWKMKEAIVNLNKCLLRLIKEMSR